MKILNPRGLPEAIVNAATPEEREVKPNRIGVTDLIGPAYLRALKIARWGELEEEVEKRWRLVIGTALHCYLDSKAPEGAATETKLQVTIGDHTVSGIPDIHHNGEIHDYKYTSVWNYVLQRKTKWKEHVCTCCGKKKYEEITD